jgi:hypothetical protein
MLKYPPVYQQVNDNSRRTARLSISRYTPKIIVRKIKALKLLMGIAMNNEPWSEAETP